jgi:hypothetical protein
MKQRPAGFSSIAGREHGAGEGERAADRQRFFALHAVVRSWGLSGNVVLDQNITGSDPYETSRRIFRCNARLAIW